MYTTQVKASVKEFIQNLKPGQMVKVVLSNKWDNRKKVVKGIVYRVDLNNFRVLAVYDEEGNSYSRGWTTPITVSEIDDISKTRFPKEISDNLKSIYKDLQAHKKLQEQLKVIEDKMNISSQKITQQHEEVKKEYINISNDISEEKLFEYMLVELRSAFMKRNQNEDNSIGVYFSYKVNKNQNHMIEITFGGSTGRGVFSKGTYESRAEYDRADYSKLVERYAPRIDKNKFTNSGWSVDMRKSVSLGDKGSLETETVITLELNKKKVNKEYLNALQDEIIKIVNKAW